jgi:hypothetical protein
MAFAIQRSISVRFHPMWQVDRRLHPARLHKPVHSLLTKDQLQLWCFGRFRAR